MAANKRDPGAQQIAEWQAWFLDGHAARLAAADLTPAARASELAAVTALGDAVAARLRDDYVRWNARGKP